MAQTSCATFCYLDLELAGLGHGLPWNPQSVVDLSRTCT